MKEIEAVDQKVNGHQSDLAEVQESLSDLFLALMTTGTGVHDPVRYE